MTRSFQRLSMMFLACALAASGSLAQNNTSEETLQQFKKYFNTYKDTPSRVEAVLTLQGLEDEAAVEILLPKLKDPESEVVRAVIKVFSGYKTRPPVEVLLATLKSDKTEGVRTGILRALADGKYSDIGAAVNPCLSDKSWEVRRRALQALAITKDPNLAQSIAPLCSDPEAAVRCEALETLTALKSPLVVEPAIKSLQDSIWQVRTSAIGALTKVRSKDSIEPLINRLAVEEGRLAPDLGEALAGLTAKEYGTDVGKWKEYWAANKEGFKLPSEEAIAYLRGHREAKTGGGGRSSFTKSGVAEFHGIETKSRSIMFVIDVSGSMEALVVEKERFEGGGYPSLARIDIVKTELSRTIDHLEPYVNFNILAFATDVDPWKKKLVPANILNKSAAKEWVGNLKAIGGASKEDLAVAGLIGSANLEKGKTNTYGALMAALNVPVGPHTGEKADKNYQTDVDTIFFLSDGRPTVGDFVDTDDILREVKSANDLRKIVIHTIAIGEFQKIFMQRMAEQNKGVFVDLGK